jgi:excinuclease ABC subunit B
MYSDQMTDSMKRAIDETNRRREVQRRYNEEHGITPRSVKSAILDLSQQLYGADPMALPMAADAENDLLIPKEIKRLIEEYTKDMQRAADEMEFEKAAQFRDRILLLKDMDLGLKPPSRALLAAPVKPAEPQAAMKGRRGPMAKGRRRQR